MKIILLGAPGSGKGTQARFISEEYGVPHISTGDIFRDNIARETALGLKIKDVINAGDLCPDDLTIEIVKERLAQDDCKNGYLLDGFPRNVVQATALEEIAPPDTVIDLEVGFSEIRRRLTGRRTCAECKGTFHVDRLGESKVCPRCGGSIYTRKDDAPESVEERIKVYQSQTKPLIGFYRELGKLVEIDGNIPAKDVFAEIKKAVK